MNIHRALGVPGASSGDTPDFMVIGLVGAVLRSGKQSVPPPPSSYRSPACFALLRWRGMIVGRTPYCRDLREPMWREQVRSREGFELTAHQRMFKFWFWSGKYCLRLPVLRMLRER